MSARDRISLALEALLWCAVLAWLIWLVRDIRTDVFAYLQVCGQDSLHWLQGCPPKPFPWRSILEFSLIGLLVWWPFLRSRIKASAGLSPH